MSSPADRRDLLRKKLTLDGFLVGDGLKYGLDFLVYTDHPEHVHSKYGVVVSENMTYQQLVAHQRMCCAVNKILVVAFVDGGCIRLMQCGRFATRGCAQQDGSTPAGLGDGP